MFWKIWAVLGIDLIFLEILDILCIFRYNLGITPVSAFVLYFIKVCMHMPHFGSGGGGLRGAPASTTPGPAMAEILRALAPPAGVH